MKEYLQRRAEKQDSNKRWAPTPKPAAWHSMKPRTRGFCFVRPPRCVRIGSRIGTPRIGSARRDRIGWRVRPGVLSATIGADYDCALESRSCGSRLAQRIGHLRASACRTNSTPPVRALVDQVLLRPAPDTGGTASKFRLWRGSCMAPAVTALTAALACRRGLMFAFWDGRQGGNRAPRHGAPQ